MIPYGRQEVTQDDVDAVVAVLRSDWLTQGPMVPRFEQTVATQCGAAYAVAVSSATAALHLACLALDLGPGDWLWTSPITFVASANCGLYCGAQVDFVDIDPATWNLCPKALESKLLLAERVGRLPKVVVPVHLAGEPCDMPAIHALAQRFGFRIIEDASHAIGARCGAEPVGNCHYSDITVFSFHPVKLITTGEGGMATTNDRALADRMALLRSHGITRDPAHMQRVPDGPWYYEQQALGFNYRMTDIQAALGLSQLARLGDYIAQRHALAGRYRALLAKLPLVFQHHEVSHHSALHLFIVRLQLDRVEVSHRAVFESMRQQGIGVNLHYIPVPLQPHYQRLGCTVNDLSCAQRYYAEAISLPLYPALTPEQQDAVVTALVATLRA